MWHSALAAAGAMLQYHVLVGGLGGVITVIVGGVISAIAIRSGKRTAVRPATNAEAAPVSQRSAPPVSYGETAPPTSPARRLHPGPVSLSEPPAPQPDEDEATLSNLFNPDLFSGDAAEPGAMRAELVNTPPPVLHPYRTLAEEWRANAAPPHSPDLTHAPIWNQSPFARPDTALGASGEAALAFDATPVTDPPIWRVGSISQRLSFASASGDVAPQAESFTPSAPIWTSWLRPGAATESAMPPEALTPGDGVEPEPPIWPSFLRRK